MLKYIKCNNLLFKNIDQHRQLCFVSCAIVLFLLHGLEKCCFVYDKQIE